MVPARFPAGEEPAAAPAASSDDVAGDSSPASGNCHNLCFVRG